MAANLEDFSNRLVRGSKKITFIFTEDFFNIVGRSGVLVDRYRDIHHVVKNAGHRKGEVAATRAGGDDALFDVNVVIIKTNFTCIVTTFKELAEGPFGLGSFILGFGSEMVDSEKAKFALESFFSDKLDECVPVSKLLAEYKKLKRKIVLVVESAADLRRPSLEPVMNLRNLKQTVLISPVKGPLVDCQVTRIADCENSNSFSTLLNMICVKY
ncbi:MAG: hypothetical protein FWC43_07030 [Planctomycetaceae bacterium]|nr:hypothetical protein [Planctomycetaceae bacterium]MCL2305081.1 hypothetical protein [Planctomycetaceae bacterium]